VCKRAARGCARGQPGGVQEGSQGVCKRAARGCVSGGQDADGG